MVRVLLDTNIYDLIDEDEDVKVAVITLCDSGILNIKVNRIISEELRSSPHGGVPKYLDVEYVGETVFLCGIGACGDSIGKGEVFHSHMGDSMQLKDALIADVASFEADIFVTEDKRCLKRFKQIQICDRCRAMDYGQFKEWLNEQQKGRHDGRPLQDGG